MSQHPLHSLFYPRAVAIVGASSRGGNPPGFVKGPLEQGFDPARVYPVNPNADQIGGLRCYPSLMDCPEPVDHVICMLPAARVLGLVEECAARSVRSIQLFTAGFSETGASEGERLQAMLVERARAAGIRLLGPNCMGLYVPEAGLSYFEGFPTEPGDVFVASQSGVNTSELVTEMASRGLRFSKVVSYGNAADIGAEDLLEYAATDPATRVVVAYVEGVRNGRAFLDALRECAHERPTIVMKGGVTGDGARAAASHTGSLAGSTEVFDAACRQVGAIRVRSMREVHDLAVATTTTLREVRGTGIALLGTGGGHAVLATDQVALEGLTVPPLPAGVQNALREFIPEAGTSVRNPVDVQVRGGTDPNLAWERTIGLVASAGPVHAVFVTIGAFTSWRVDDAEGAERLARVQDRIPVPLVVIRAPRAPALRRAGGEDVAGSGEAFDLRAHQLGLAVFPSVERAARATARWLDWRVSRAGLPAFA